MLKEDKENRSTHYFDNIKYIVIDDPVSSMDDSRIITIALELLALLEIASNLKILITTHHCLFFNVLYCKQHRGWNQYNWFLSKIEDNKLLLEHQE